MKSKNPDLDFYQRNASSFDNQRARLAPMKDALHLFIRILFSDLPENATVLCVGVGTGAELIYLAQEFPSWTFTAVDPSSAMMAICRRRAEEAGITSRCTFHEGYLDLLPDSSLFDAATSILVSHYLGGEEKQINYFLEIAARLRPGAYMVNATLASDTSSPKHKMLLDGWAKMLDYAGMPPFGGNEGLLPIGKVESIIKSGGFDSPTLFFQTLFIHAWLSTTRIDREF